MEIVPVSLRYNVNNYIGVGIGPQIYANLNQKQKRKRKQNIIIEKMVLQDLKLLNLPIEKQMKQHLKR